MEEWFSHTAVVMGLTYLILRCEEWWNGIPRNPKTPSLRMFVGYLAFTSIVMYMIGHLLDLWR